MVMKVKRMDSEVREVHRAGQIEQVEQQEAVVVHNGLECGHVLEGIEELVNWQEDEGGAWRAREGCTDSCVQRVDMHTSRRLLLSLWVVCRMCRAPVDICRCSHES
jgi:hypothetical protein